MGERFTRYPLVEALEIVDAVDGRVDGEENFDVTGDGLVGRDDGP